MLGVGRAREKNFGRRGVNIFKKMPFFEKFPILMCEGSGG